MINITTGIDLAPLQKELFSRHTRPAYIIMSKKTIEAIELKYPTVQPVNIREDEMCNAFMGIPVAICNALQYGVVDIKD